MWLSAKKGGLLFYQRRRVNLNYMIFATVSVALMLSSISATSIAVAFPIITSYFMVPLTIAGWIISVYQLGFTVTMPIIGKVSDVFSRKSTFYTIFSVLSTSFPCILCTFAAVYESQQEVTSKSCGFMLPANNKQQNKNKPKE